MAVRPRERGWVDFVGWCKARGLSPLPAHPWTLAAYARWCEARYRFPLIIGRIRAISRAHLLRCVSAPDRHPLVVRTLRLIEQRQATPPPRAALFDAPEPGPAGRTCTTAEDRPKPRPARRSRRQLRVTPPLVARRPAE